MSSPNSSLLKVDVVRLGCDQSLAGLALAAVPVGILIAALAATSSAALAWYVLVALSSGLLCGWALWREGVLGGQRRLRSIELLADGSWSLTDANGSYRLHLLPGSRAGRGWLWLRWAPSAGRCSLQTRSLLLTRGDLPADGMRRLQLYVRWTAGSERLLRNRRGVLAAPGGG